MKPLIDQQALNYLRLSRDLKRALAEARMAESVLEQFIGRPEIAERHLRDHNDFAVCVSWLNEAITALEGHTVPLSSSETLTIDVRATKPKRKGGAR